MTLRARVLAIARRSVGLSAAPSKLEDFGLLMGRGEVAQVRKDMATWRNPKTGQSVSTCALVDRGIFCEAGVDEPLVRPKYVPATAFSTVKHVAEKRKALRKPGGGALPSSGDVFAVGADTTDGHMGMVESLQKNLDGTVTVISIDGGQVSRKGATAPDDPGGVQMVARKRRTWTPDGRGGWTDKAVIIAPAGYDSYTARPVSWWVDIDALEAGGPTFDPGGPQASPGAPGDASPAPTASASPSPAPPRPQGLTVGSSGPEVVRWQGILGVETDGRFGPLTFAATKAWQAAHGLPVTGVVGQDSWAVATAKKTDPAIPAVVEVLEGIDVSHYQASARFDEVAKAGVRFVLVKLGQGSHLIPPYADKSAAKLCAGVRDVGLLLGGYHYLMGRHGAPQDAKTQAEDFFDAWERERATLAELDVETKNNEKSMGVELRDASAQFLDRWDTLSGKTPILVYSSKSEADAALLHQIPGIGEYPLSVANYGVESPALPKAWKSWTLWQYTGAGRVPGITGDCDRYRFRGTETELRAFGRSGCVVHSSR